MNGISLLALILSFFIVSPQLAQTEETRSYKPYTSPCVERENVFEFTEKPQVRVVAKDKYEITFSVKGYCDVTVAIVDPSKDITGLRRGFVVRHLGSGVLGANAPAPFQKNSLNQTIYWNGKDDLDVYVKQPEKLKVRVSLGLNPTFDKLLGPSSPKALPGYVLGIAIDNDGVYVFSMGYERGHVNCRKFDHDARYLKTLWPPSSELPPEKLGGMGYIEYEPGKYAVQAPIIDWGLWREGFWMPPTFEGSSGVLQCRPAVFGKRIYLMSSGFNHREFKGKKIFPPKLYFINTDGSTDYEGLRGRIWIDSQRVTSCPHIAISPDGKWLYLVGFQNEGGEQPAHVLLRGPLTISFDTEKKDYLTFPQGNERPVPIVGKGMGRHERIPGSDDRHLNCPRDVDCDSAGRVYVTDTLNNRVQVFDSDGNVLKTIRIERPQLVQVHKKNGFIYISHFDRRHGISVPCISKFKPFPDLQQTRRWYDIPSAVMTLDSYSIKPRLWISGIHATKSGTQILFGKGALLRVYEDDDTDELKLVSDFEREAYSENESGFRWPGGMGNKVVCDPLRERVYWNNEWIFDLPSGKLLGRAPMGRLSPSEIAFDKHGYMHIHQGGHAAPKPIIRVSPDRVESTGRYEEYAEVPYDYGVEFSGYKGVILPPATDTQFYSWGMGVNMHGDIAVVNHIGYVPKLQDEVTPLITLSQQERRNVGMWTFDSFAVWLKNLANLERLGEDLFFIRPRPGIPLYGGTIWTYRRSGELNTQASVIAGPRINGVQIDEEGFVYFTNARRRYIHGQPFLYGRGGNFGGSLYIPHNFTPFTGTYMKTRAKGVDFILRNPTIPMEPPPNRPPDLAHPAEGNFGAYLGKNGWVWVESAEWMYAGASGIVAEHCDCPQMRACLDWFKRSFVPELYRHSIGVLDTNGNLICHVGQYGNFDNKGIVMIRGHYVSTTDNYLVISDWGQRLIVAKLQYHAEEMADITTQ